MTGFNGRSCNGCTLCCFTHPVPELPKRASTLCQHCTVGAGCRVYNDKPASCGDYVCGWIEGIGTEDDQPHLLGVVYELAELTEVPLGVLKVIEPRPGDVQHLRAQSFLQSFLNAGRIVHVANKIGSYYLIPRTTPENIVFGEQRERQGWDVWWHEETAVS